MKKYELWKKCYRLYPKINCHGGDRVLKALSPLFARHGRALTGESPEHARIVGSV